MNQFCIHAIKFKKPDTEESSCTLSLNLGMGLNGWKSIVPAARREHSVTGGGE